MDKFKVYNLAGEVVGEQALDPKLFGVEVNPRLVQQVVVAQAANARRPWAHTKLRSEVRGGGRKPWRQKGTGRARHGSSRSPIWRGGGVTFGPRSDRNYQIAVNKKAKKSALRMVLSDRAKNGQLILVDSLQLPEIKTKQVVQALERLPLKGRKTIFVLDKNSDNMAISSRNIPEVGTLGADSLNIRDLLHTQNVVIPVSALETINKLYGAN